MSWKNIKTFLIVLFLLINMYLIFSQYGFDFKMPDKTYINEKTLADTINVIKNNYNIRIDENTVPKKVDNLGIIDASNIIYTDKFKNSGYEFSINGASFKTDITTNITSYNENNASASVNDFLASVGIEKGSYKISSVKGSSRLKYIANEILEPYSIFNGKIEFEFSPESMSVSGSWYITPQDSLKNTETPSKMSDITGIIIDLASQAAKSDGSEVKIIGINYGYYVSSYDKNKVSKSSSAIPCYVLETDDENKFYYDALNGKQLK